MFTSALNSFATGLALQERRLSAAARNIANLTTAGYKATSVIGQTTADGGVTSRVVSAGGAGTSSVGGSSAASTTNLVDDTATQITARAAVKAQASGVRTADKMLGYLIDVRV